MQPKVFGPHFPRAPSTTVKKTKQRSIATEDEALSIYIAGEREGPMLSQTKVDINTLEVLFKKED